MQTMYAGDEVYGDDDITSGPLPDALEEPDDEDEEQDESVQAPWPTLYVDGEAQNDSNGDELERVQVEFDDVANGMLNDKQLLGPLAWCNSATIHLDRDEDAVHVLISVGDPRGAFGFTVRRYTDTEGKTHLVMHTPYPGEPMPHMDLTEIRPGTYEIGG